jgi:DNA-binding transcriptional MerR regulator
MRNNSSKHRVYSEDDITLIISIACLNATGMSLKDMCTYLNNRQKGALAANQQVNLLMTQQSRLAAEARFLELRQHYVETKIAYWKAIAVGDNDTAATISRNTQLIAKELKLPKEK